MAKFDLASVFAAANVSESDTKEKIEYIDIDLIDPDPNNFYKLSDLEALVANIELLGLQQPLRVRTGENDHVVIVSGHRRYAALHELVNSGRADLRSVPCIRERADASPALQELRLIYANSDTRRLTSSELAKQAERVEALLYQLKEEGYEFPGRMRDHVAEACKVSKTKLARLKVIRDNLISEWYAHYANGDLAESTAYTIAQMPMAHQMALYSGVAEKGHNLKVFYESEANRYGKKMSFVEGKQCPKRNGAICDNVANKLKRICNRRDDYMLTTPCAACCAECEYLISCGYACDLCCAEKQAAKDEKKAAKAAEKAEQERRELEAAQRDRDIIRLIDRMWGLYDNQKAARGFEDDAYMDATNIRRYQMSRPDKISKYSRTPLGIDGDDVSHICNAADFLGMSIDYLLGRTDSIQMGRASDADSKLGIVWHSCNEEPKIGAEIVVIDRFGVADSSVYEGSKTLRDAIMDWKEVTLWTPMPKGATEATTDSEPPAAGWVALQFVDGMEAPPKDGKYYCRFDCEGMIIEQLAWWDGIRGTWSFKASGEKIGAKCLGWFPLPEETQAAGGAYEQD